MEKSIKLEDVDESNLEEHLLDNERIAVDLLNEDYSGITDVKEELNEKLDCHMSYVEIEEHVTSEKGKLWNREDRIILRPERIERKDSSSMNCSSLSEVKKELSDTSNSSFEDYSNGDTRSNIEFGHEEGSISIKEDEEFVIDNEESGSIKMEMDDSCPECIEHLIPEKIEDGNPQHVYCKYCENYVFCKSITLHLNTWHKDEYTSQKGKKDIYCKFCGNYVLSRNLLRHLETHHHEEKEVQKILLCPINSKERKRAVNLFRNNKNVNLFLSGVIEPHRLIRKEGNSNEYIPCVHCKGFYTKKTLKVHEKSCSLKEEYLISVEKSKENQLSYSQSVTKRDVDDANIISSLNVKEKVFHLMKPDRISLEAKRDILIAHIGEYYFNNHKSEHITHTVISKMRELSCLLIAYRTLVKDENLSFSDIIDPSNFSRAMEAVKIIAGYDNERKKFNCPNLAENIGNSLKLACTELICLILKENMHKIMKSLNDRIKWIQNVKIFKEMVETQWNAELMPVVGIEPPAKVRKKPSLLNLAVQLKHFQGEVLRIAYQCQRELFTNSWCREYYKLLVQASLVLLYLSNKRNVEEIPFMKIEDYQDDKPVCIKDFEHVLSHVEKVLTTKHKRVLVTKQGSEKFLILIPYVIQCFINVILKHRDKYMETDNKYIFAIPGSHIEWGDSDVAMRNLCKVMDLKQKCIGRNKFRKYTATIMGILNLSQGELQQFGHFMGCALETYNQFYVVPIDAFQTAKLSKLLQIMEEGPILSKYMGKCLADIDIDPDDEFAGDDNGESDDVNSITTDDGYVEDGIEVCTDNTNQKDIKEAYLFEKLNGNTTPNENNCENDQQLSKKDQYVSVISFQKLIKLCDKPDYTDKFHNGFEKVQKIRKKKVYDISCKRGWTNNEIALIEKDFGCFIQSGVYPPGKELNNFLLKNNITKTVPTLRSKIQHLIRVKNKF